MEANNMAAMREALEEIVSNIETRASAFDIFSIIDRKTFLDAKAALALPRRQCDVGTAEEQIERFNHQCFEHHTGRCSSHCKTLPAKTFQACALKWAQMPYEEGDSDGSK